MRSVKTHGGLTRGKGMTENKHFLWVLSMPTCAYITEDVQKYTSISYQTSDQHIAKLQMLKTLSLTVDLISYLKALEPFSIIVNCRIIANGMSDHEGVTADHAREIKYSFIHDW